MTHTITATNGAGATSPLAVAGYDADRKSRNVVHDLLDGTIGLSLVPPRPRSGALTLVYTDRAEAFAAYALFATPTTFTYATSGMAELGMMFALDGALGIEQDDEDTDIWYVNVGYQEA